MFTLPVSDILTSYSWDSKNFSFSGEVFDGYYDDIRFIAPLEFNLKIIWLDDAVEVVFEKFQTKVEYEGKKHPINISGFERTWKTHIDPLEDGDDIYQIDTKNMSIDLAPVIREEIIMACHEL